MFEVNNSQNIFFRQNVYLVYPLFVLFYFAAFPVINMTDLEENPSYTVGDEVTVTCTIDRIYPEIEPADFIMTWNDNETANITKNIDESYKSIVTMSKTLTVEDHQRNITCKVTPKVGPAVPEVRRTLRVECE